MNDQLQELLKKVYEEGVAKANAEAEKIINSAKEQAEDTVSQAKQKAETILKEAEKKAADHKKNT
jgi:V/A-type H+-transporting ATPase subunit E